MINTSMKLLDYINQNLGLNEEDDGIVIEERLADWLLGWLQENTPMYSSSDEMFQDLVSQLQNVTHDMIGLDAEDSTVTAPLGLNFNHNGQVADAVISELGNDLQNYLQPRDEYGDLLPEDKYQRREEEYEKIMKAHQQGGEEAYAKACGLSMEELDQEMGEISRDLNLHMDDDRDEILQRHAEDTVGKFEEDADTVIAPEDEADEPLIPNIVNDDGEIVANDWDSAIELAQQNRIDADDLEFIEKEQDSSSLLDFLGGFYDIEEPVEEDADTVIAPEDEAEDNVAKMVAIALGDESRWNEMSAHELYSELESVDAEMADVIKMTAKLIHDVDLTESKAAKQS